MYHDNNLSPIVLQVYDGSNVSMPLITTLNDVRLIPPPIFSTGPSLTMAYKTYPKPGSLDMSYTSTDKGKILQVYSNIISTCIIYWCVVSTYR